MPITYDEEHEDARAQEYVQLGWMSPAAAEALTRLREALRASGPLPNRLYHDIELALQRVQRNRVGPLTDCLKALVWPEESQ